MLACCTIIYICHHLSRTSEGRNCGRLRWPLIHTFKCPTSWKMEVAQPRTGSTLQLLTTETVQALRLAWFGKLPSSMAQKTCWMLLGANMGIECRMNIIEIDWNRLKLIETMFYVSICFFIADNIDSERQRPKVAAVIVRCLWRGRDIYKCCWRPTRWVTPKFGPDAGPTRLEIPYQSYTICGFYWQQSSNILFVVNFQARGMRKMLILPKLRGVRPMVRDRNPATSCCSGWLVTLVWRLGREGLRLSSSPVWLQYVLISGFSWTSTFDIFQIIKLYQII